MVTLDPRNTVMSPQRASQNSLLVVPGDYSEHRMVPHGSVLEQHFVSSTLGGIDRRLIIYTPPGYEKGVNLITRETPGGHDWRNWRDNLHEFAPLLFR